MKRDIFKFFVKLRKYRTDFNELKTDREKGAVSSLFGRRAIYNTIGTVLLIALAVGLAALGFAAIATEGFFVVILGAIAFGAGGATVLIAVAYEIVALMCVSRQMRLSKRAIGVVSLVLNLILLAAIIVIAVIVLNIILAGA